MECFNPSKSLQLFALVHTQRRPLGALERGGPIWPARVGKTSVIACCTRAGVHLRFRFRSWHLRCVFDIPWESTRQTTERQGVWETQRRFAVTEEMDSDCACRGEGERGIPMRHAQGYQRTRVGQITISALATLLFLAGAWFEGTPARADDAQDARQLVEKARLAFESFQADPQMGPNLRAIVQRAKGVMIYPEALRGAFLFGASGGTGVFLTRQQGSDSWAGPAFYSFGEASFGLQAGGEASEVILVALTDKGVAALLTTSGKLGANGGVAVGPVGVGAEAATANLSADLVSYSRNKGLYAGISVEGAIVSPENRLAQAYYGREVTPTQILVQREVNNPHAAVLIAALERVTGGSASSQRAAAKRK